MSEAVVKSDENSETLRNIVRYLLIPLFLLLLIITATACGDKEQAQQQAFIQFLQTQLLASQSVKVPALTVAQQKELGHYGKDYAIITDFQHQLTIEINSSLVPVFTNMNALTSVNALLEQRNDLQKMANSSQQWLEELKNLRDRADAQRTALKQSAAVKGAYDPAYNKVVTQPAAVAEKIYTLLPEVLNQIVIKADFIKSQGKNVTISGNTLQFSTQAQLDKYHAIQKRLLPLNAQLMALSQQMQQQVD